MITNATPQSTVTMANDIRDIKPPIAILNGWEWIWWTLGALVVLTLLLLAWRYFLKRMTRVSIAPPVPAHIRARQKLEEALALISQPKEFCILVSDTIRFYLEERFDFRAPERTTEEFLRELNATDLLLPEQKESLGKFLESCDLVKFAKYEPGENELRELHSSALQLVEETEPKEAKTESESQESGNELQATSEIENHRQFSEESVLGRVVPVTTTAHKAANFSKAQTLAIVGTVLQLAPVVWVIDYYASIYRYFKFLVDAPNNLSEHGVTAFLPELLSQEFMLANHASWLFDLILGVMLIGLIGLVSLLISLTALRYRAEWFFWFLIIYGAMLCGTFPFGTIFGVFFLVYCLTKRREFLKRT